MWNQFETRLEVIHGAMSKSFNLVEISGTTYRDALPHNHKYVEWSWEAKCALNENFKKMKVSYDVADCCCFIH